MPVNEKRREAYMKRLWMFLTLLLVAGALVCAGCGKGDSTSGVPGAPGSNTDVDAFFKDYTAFIDDYCAAADKYQGASMNEKAALLRDLGTKSLKLAEYANQAIAIKASMAPGSEEKLDELGKRVDECQKKFQTP